MGYPPDTCRVIYPHGDKERVCCRQMGHNGAHSPRDRERFPEEPIVENVPSHPRYVRELMEGEVMILITGEDALLRLTRDCRFPEPKARRLLNIAWEFGQKAEPCPGGYVHIWYHGKDDTGQHVFSVVEHIGNSQPERVAAGKDKRYTQSKDVTPSRKTGKAEPNRTTKGTTMPPKRTRNTRQADPEPEAPANGEVDYQKYVTKDFSATMADYITWMDANVPGWDKLEVDRILVLGVQLYSNFQKSDFNIEQREARRAERDQGGAAPEPAPATRTRSTRTKPAPAATARAGARSGRATGNGKPPAKPARTRSRATANAGAADGGDSPF